MGKMEAYLVDDRASSVSGSILFKPAFTDAMPCKKLFELIINDTSKLVPPVTFSSLENLVEYSNYYTEKENLLKAYFNSTFNETVQKHMYLIALTTIWISVYLNPNRSSDVSKNYSKKAKLNYQICLLYYCFGILVGHLPAKGVQFAKSQGFTWKKTLSNADDGHCIIFAMELMNKFNLCYTSPCDGGSLTIIPHHPNVTRDG